jgi:hypothetical protein
VLKKREKKASRKTRRKLLIVLQPPISDSTDLKTSTKLSVTSTLFFLISFSVFFFWRTRGYKGVTRMAYSPSLWLMAIGW